MNNIDAVILALLTLNIFLVCLISTNSMYSHLYVWSGLGSTCLPLLAIYLNLIPHKHLLKLKARSKDALVSIQKIISCCFKDVAVQERDLLNTDDIPGLDQMVHPNQYIRGDSSEHVALLHNSKCLYTYK